MLQLTKAEEDIMQIIWRMEKCLVSDILNYMEEELGLEKPPHSSVSSVVRILESKGFVAHKAYGRTHEYFPVITKEDYTKSTLEKLVTDYFEGSMSNLVSFLVRKQDLSPRDLEKLIERLNKDEEITG